MEFSTVLNTRKSVRSFTGEAISEAARKAILHAANAAPVGLGKYDSLHLTVVRDKALLAELEQNTARFFQAERSFLYNAPELVIVSTAATDNVGYSNAAIVAHSMALAAVAEGAGVCHIWCCPIALGTDPELTARLGIPAGFTPACSVALGQTAELYSERQIPDSRIPINMI